MRESEISVLNASSQYSQSATLKAFPKPDGVYSVQCEECGDQTYHLPKFARGEPRNIAVIGMVGNHLVHLVNTAVVSVLKRLLLFLPQSVCKIKFFYFLVNRLSMYYPVFNLCKHLSANCLKVKTEGTINVLFTSKIVVTSI